MGPFAVRRTSSHDADNMSFGRNHTDGGYLHTASAEQSRNGGKCECAVVAKYPGFQFKADLKSCLYRKLRQCRVGFLCQSPA